MIDLEQVSGIPMEVTDDFHLKLKPGTVMKKSSVRSLEEMRPVLFDLKAQPAREELYYMYRGICREVDQKKIEDAHLQYDVTILPPVMLGEEYNKTLGHYHANIEGTGIAHPEMYEVLHGKALFLLQKMDADLKKVVTILAVEGEKGDKIIYPPNYGHIIVNIGDEPVITANWISTDYHPMYEPIKEKEGMALYVIRGSDGKPTFVKNENYEDQPIMRRMNMTDKIRTDFGIDTQDPMYTIAMNNLELLDFLNHPMKHAVQLSALSS